MIRDRRRKAVGAQARWAPRVAAASRFDRGAVLCFPSDMVRYLCVCLLLTLSGCIALARGARQPIAFDSVPPGARVAIDGGQPSTCQTPCTIAVKRSDAPTSYTVTLDGHEELDGELIPGPMNKPGWLPVAIIDGLTILPGIIDLATYSTFDYPKQVSATLPPEGHGGARAVVTR